MTADVQAAVMMMAAAMPTMFIVIGLFIVLTNMLVKSFPEDDA